MTEILKRSELVRMTISNFAVNYW